MSGIDISSQIQVGDPSVFRFTGGGGVGYRVVRFPDRIHVEACWEQLKDNDPDAKISYNILYNLPGSKFAVDSMIYSAFGNGGVLRPVRFNNYDVFQKRSLNNPKAWIEPATKHPKGKYIMFSFDYEPYV